MMPHTGFLRRAAEQKGLALPDGGLTHKGGLMAVSKDLLDILVCPQCKGDIRLNESQDGLICDRCKLLYHIKDDIPIMLIDEATKLE
jgi:uncharacterized protein YbaR (Trm112 family)